MARTALFIGLALLIGGLAAEAVARAYVFIGGEQGARLAKRDPLNVLFEPHGTYGYRQRPSRSQLYGNGTQANWNELRYRGPLVRKEKPTGTFRVLLLGGSTTHGFGVEDSQTIDAHMREILQARFPHIDTEVVNLGLGGYDSHQLLERMRSDGLSFDPDIVILNSGINDVRNARFSDLEIPDPRTMIWETNMRQMTEDAKRGGPGLWTRILHYSYAARLPGFLSESLSRRQVMARDPSLPLQPDVLDYFEANIRSTADLAQSIGAGLVLSTPPSSLETRYAPDTPPERDYWIVDAATTDAYRRQLAARLERIAAEETEQGSPVTYVAAELPPDLFLDDCHLTGAGNAAVAEAFVDALVPHLARAFPDRLAGRPN